MGRPRVYDEPRITTAVRLPLSVREALPSVASARQVSVNHVVTTAIEDFLPRQAQPSGGEGAGAAS